MTFPRGHRAKLHSANPIERLDGENKRRTEVVGISPNDDAIVRLVGATLLEQNDEWAVQRARYMALETISQMSDDPVSYTTLRDTIKLVFPGKWQAGVKKQAAGPSIKILADDLG